MNFEIKSTKANKRNIKTPSLSPFPLLKYCTPNPPSCLFKISFLSHEMAGPMACLVTPKLFFFFFFFFLPYRSWRHLHSSSRPNMSYPLFGLGPFITVSLLLLLLLTSSLTNSTSTPSPPLFTPPAFVNDQSFDLFFGVP